MNIEKRILFLLPLIIIILSIYIMILMYFGIMNHFLIGILIGFSISFLIMVFGKSKELAKILEKSNSN